ncbi:YmfQ family protein [Cytobacillus firmus]|uniref:YmfQ family protein n=1 Tax=Cytobacillus firmus TaxID=1399 RepID=UPI0018CDA351|nr:YmfQ family protein [Cytobacillus firmus]MBG9548507.1 phage portal protein [Cytobacillus firmus]MBG9602930.1 phage portal protein [Cytobacillus firmus]MBG9654885.1 phage portal protein [Cytobacillus firmus]MED1906107.1 YmfQ family protein [Cytobacillus firmus]MED1941522.1 YmfQ family protein [Cytobacillus firmus]
MINRDINQSMYDYLPKYYEDVPEVRAIIDTESAAFEQLHVDINDVLAQFFVDTATWGLANWEHFLAIPVDESKPVNQRRELIKSKLRGIGTVTVALIKNVAESYSNGEVDVIEVPVDYTIRIKFVGKLGVPENLVDIQTAIRNILPAHLAVNFEFTFVLYDQLKTEYVDYNALAASGLTYEELLTTI